MKLETRSSKSLLDDEELRAKLRAASKTHLEGIRSVFSERLTPSELESLRDLLQRLPLDDAAVSCEP